MNRGRNPRGVIVQGVNGMGGGGKCPGGTRQGGNVRGVNGGGYVLECEHGFKRQYKECHLNVIFYESSLFLRLYVGLIFHKKIWKYPRTSTSFTA